MSYYRKLNQNEKDLGKKYPTFASQIMETMELARIFFRLSIAMTIIGFIGLIFFIINLLNTL